MANRIDFHLHTNVSDGSDTVEGLLDKVKKTNVHTFSVTDHDRVEGSLEMAQLIRPEDNLTHILGMEFSCTTPVKKCHILGYNFDPSNPKFKEVYDLGIRLRQEKTQKRIDYWENERGITLTKEEADWLLAQKSPGRPTFGKIILDRGLAPDMTTAVREFVTPCKVGNDRIDAAAAIEAVKSAGGVTVWAHPLGGEGEKRLTMEEFYSQLGELLEDGVQGMECYYSRYSQEDISFLVSVAKEHNLLISGGSDYHGDNKPNLHIGKFSEDDMDVDVVELSLYQIFSDK